VGVMSAVDGSDRAAFLPVCRLGHFTWDILQGPGEKKQEVITSGNVSFLYVRITERDNICLLIATTLKQRVFLS